jgi:hypothetical protein
MGILPNILFLSPSSDSPKFPRFSDFPLEIRLKIWVHAIDVPSSQIVSAKLRSSGATLFPRPPRWPALMLAVMHTCREARTEILNTYQILRFPVQFSSEKLIYGNVADAPSSAPADCWPVTRSTEHRYSSLLEKRWRSRGSHIVNKHSDTVFFSRWATKDFMRVYGTDFVAAIIFALSEVRYLAISMQSWKEAGTAWLKVFELLDRVKEVVFVREPGYRYDFRYQEADNGEGNLRLVELGEEVDGADYDFSGQLWSMRIKDELEKKSVASRWKFPPRFMDIVVGMPSNRYILQGLLVEEQIDNAPVRNSRDIRDDYSWRMR